MEQNITFGAEAEQHSRQVSLHRPPVHAAQVHGVGWHAGVPNPVPSLPLQARQRSPAAGGRRRHGGSLGEGGGAGPALQLPGDEPRVQVHHPDVRKHHQ